MSTIGVKYHNEDIHNIIRKPMSPTIKSPRYKSKRKFLTELALIERNKYNGHQTFGLARYEAPEAKNYLRKGKPRISPPSVKLINRKEFKCTITSKNSPIPKPSYENRKREKKNFVKENIKKAESLKPKVPVPRRVETPRGTSKDLAHLIQMIKIRQSEEYGKIPKYLFERKKREEKERRKRELEMQALRERREKLGIGTMGMGENVYMIDKGTRQEILDGLKENWNELSKQFLKLPVMTDTWPKIKRKMWLEKEIEQLEKDIKLVESHPYIYLERHDGAFYEKEVADDINKNKHEKKVADDVNQNKMQKQKDMEVKEEKLEKEEEKQVIEPSEEEISEEKKEEDKEINILNY